VAADLILAGSGRVINTVDERVDPGIAHDQVSGFPQIPAEIRRLADENVPPWRTDIMQGPHDLASAAPLLEYPSANGDDPMALERLMQVRLSFCKGARWGRYYEIADPDSPVLKLLNVRYVISSNALPQPGGLAPVSGAPGIRIYENPGALPRFFLVSQTLRAAGMEEALAILRSRGFDAHTEAVVEGTAAMEGGAAAGTVRVLRYGARQWMLLVDTPAPAFLVTSETAYPGWHAWIDGRPHTPVMTNAAFRGLRIPAGTHVVTMRFDPEILWRSAWVTLGAGLTLALAVWFGDNRQAKGPWTSRSN